MQSYLRSHGLSSVTVYACATKLIGEQILAHAHTLWLYFIFGKCETQENKMENGF